MQNIKSLARPKIRTEHDYSFKGGRQGNYSLYKGCEKKWVQSILRQNQFLVHRHLANLG
jgi:hypothetical protein